MSVQRLSDIIDNAPVSGDHLVALIVLANDAPPSGAVSICRPQFAVRCRVTAERLDQVLADLEAAELIHRWGSDDWYAFEPEDQRPAPSDGRCPRGLRRATIAESECRCAYCGGEGDALNGPDGKAWHIDRVIPGAQGGEYVAGNVVASCGPCNIEKGPRTLLQWAQDLEVAR